MALVEKAQAANTVGRTTQIEYRWRCKDGSYLWVDTRCKPIAGPDGRVEMLELWSRDVTARKHAEEALRENETRLRTLGDNIPGGALYQLLMPPDGRSRYTYLSAGFERIFGIPVDRVIADPSAFWDLIVEEDRPRLAAAERQAARNMTLFECEFRQRTAGGEVRWIHARSTPRRLNNGSILWDGVAADITERKRAEEATRQSEAEFRVMFEMASIGMAQADPRTGRFVRVNRKMSAITGYSAEEMSAMRVLDITHPDDRGGDWERFQCVVRGEAPDYRLEKRYVRKDGTLAWVNVNMTVIRDPAGQPLSTLAMIEDITERKRAEEERTRVATAMQQAAEAIVMTDAQGAILYVNPAFEKITGYTREEAVGQNPRILKSGKHDAAFYKQIWDTLRCGEVWRGRLINRRKDGTLYEEAATISPMRDTAGTVVNYVAIKLDITREAVLETQLRQSQKMEVVGRLAGGVAHDFNNLLTAILGYSDMMLKALSAVDPLRKHVEEVRSAGERAAALTRQLLAFSRKQALLPQVLDLNDLVANLSKMLRRLINEDIQLTTRFASALGCVKADPGQIEQVITNLAVNSRDAMPEGGTLTIQTANAELDPSYASQHPDVTPGPYVALLISDTGSGMTEEVLSHLFEPFFTTKGQGKGTGLGLATVYGIVKQSGGHIAVYSEVGLGTTFKVYLPRVQEAVPVAVAPERPRSLPRGTETILLVEDDAQVRNLAHLVLEECGYTVLVAGNGPDAIQLSARNEGKIQLLLTDVVMPHIGGRSLAPLLASHNPGIQVIYMSGYTETHILRDGLLSADSHFLQKPFSMEVLARKVRDVLDAT